MVRDKVVAKITDVRRIESRRTQRDFRITVHQVGTHSLPQSQVDAVTVDLARCGRCQRDVHHRNPAATSTSVRHGRRFSRGRGANVGGQHVSSAYWH